MLNFLIAIIFFFLGAVYFGRFFLVEYSKASYSDTAYPFQYGFQDPASSFFEGIIDLHHDFLMLLIVMIFLIFFLLVDIFFFFDEKTSDNPPINSRFHKKLENLWTIIPSMLLVSIAIPSFALIYSMEDVNPPVLTIKANGNQWYWSYELFDVKKTVSIKDFKWSSSLSKKQSLFNDFAKNSILACEKPKKPEGLLSKIFKYFAQIFESKSKKVKVSPENCSTIFSKIVPIETYFTYVCRPKNLTLFLSLQKLLVQWRVALAHEQIPTALQCLGGALFYTEIKTKWVYCLDYKETHPLLNYSIFLFNLFKWYIWPESNFFKYKFPTREIFPGLFLYQFGSPYIDKNPTGLSLFQLYKFSEVCASLLEFAPDIECPPDFDKIVEAFKKSNPIFRLMELWFKPDPVETPWWTRARKSMRFYPNLKPNPLDALPNVNYMLKSTEWARCFPEIWWSNCIQYDSSDYCKNALGNDEDGYDRREYEREQKEKAWRIEFRKVFPPFSSSFYKMTPKMERYFKAWNESFSDCLRHYDVHYSKKCALELRYYNRLLLYIFWWQHRYSYYAFLKKGFYKTIAEYDVISETLHFPVKKPRLFTLSCSYKISLEHVIPIYETTYVWPYIFYSDSYRYYLNAMIYSFTIYYYYLNIPTSAQLNDFLQPQLLSAPLEIREVLLGQKKFINYYRVPSAVDFYKNTSAFRGFQNKYYKYSANMISEEDILLKKGSLTRLLSPDKKILLPSGVRVRLLTTGVDVIHSWTIPSFGVKLDAIPGRLNASCFITKRPGVYFGQCSELCGVNHAFMPIKVEVVDTATFLKRMYAAG